jgi:3-oxoacid CoA-transferase
VIENGGFPIKYGKDSKTIEIESKKRETKEFNGKKFLLEESITGDFSLIKAWRADEKGNI